MPTTFDTNPVLLQTLLRNCEEGRLQLPDFQRSWVWEEERIMSLIASVSRGFPMGALMSLKSQIGGSEIFARRPIEGSPVSAVQTRPEQLLLDGQGVEVVADAGDDAAVVDLAAVEQQGNAVYGR